LGRVGDGRVRLGLVGFSRVGPDWAGPGA